jgi:hypothetical protein
VLSFRYCLSYDVMCHGICFTSGSLGHNSDLTTVTFYFFSIPSSIYFHSPIQQISSAVIVTLWFKFSLSMAYHNIY